MKLTIVPMTTDEANAFILSYHRHSKPRMAKFAIGVSNGELVGVALVGRPVARELQDGTTAEVLRCCVTNEIEPATDSRGARHANGVASMLYAACWRAWRAMGGRRLVTYTLQSEGGASLRGAGAKVIAELPPRDPKAWQSRPKREWIPVVGQAKFRWEWAT